MLICNNNGIHVIIRNVSKEVLDRFLCTCTARSSVSCRTSVLEVKPFGHCQQHIFAAGDVRVLDLLVYRGWHFEHGGEKVMFMDPADVTPFLQGRDTGMLRAWVWYRAIGCAQLIAFCPVG